jgi:hypothetical protein
MDPRQDPETLELFKAYLAPHLFDNAIPASHLENAQTVIGLVQDGLVLMRKTERGWECQLTEAGKTFTAG